MIKITKSNTSLDEPLEKRKLEQAIFEKQKLFAELIESLEHLKIDLSTLKTKYDQKVGRLYLKLDEIDLEILKFEKIEDLLAQGFSFEEARKSVEETFKKQQEQIKEEYSKLNDEEKEINKRKNLTEEEQKELKKLYYKLAHKFHPDLTKGDDTMMKKINKAYAEADIEMLKTIDKNEVFETTEILNIEELKSNIEILEKSIKKAKEEYKKLDNSEWAILKKNIEKTKGKKRDMLDELAKKVLIDIAKKENQLNEFKKKYG